MSIKLPTFSSLRIILLISLLGTAVVTDIFAAPAKKTKSSPGSGDNTQVSVISNTGFVPMCSQMVQTAVYTITNKTPSPNLLIGSIAILKSTGNSDQTKNDNMPDGASVFDDTLKNSCKDFMNNKTPLPPNGGTCKLKINFVPMQVGVINRAIKVTYNTGDGKTISSYASINVTNCISTSLPLTPGFANYTLFSNQGITATGKSVITGDVGVTPGTTLTGIKTLPDTSGPATTTGSVDFYGKSTAITNKLDTASADINVMDKALYHQTSVNPIWLNDLAENATYTPGSYLIYPSTTSGWPPIKLTGTITLDANNDPNAVFFFALDSGFTTATGSTIPTVKLINGAKSENVYWYMLGPITIGDNTTLKGTIFGSAYLATTPPRLSNISIGKNVKIEGRVITTSGTITLDSPAINPLAAP